MEHSYEKEIRERWGNTDAYREYSLKTKKHTKEKRTEVNEGLTAVFTEFAVCKERGKTAASKEAQELVLKLQSYITENYYTCSDEILLGLGRMYVCDERFKNNINKNGEGAAEFAAEAIELYCKERGNKDA